MGVSQDSTVFHIIYERYREFKYDPRKKLFMQMIRLLKNQFSMSIKTSNVSSEDFYRWCKNSGLTINIKKIVFMILQQKKTFPTISVHL